MIVEHTWFNAVGYLTRQDGVEAGTPHPGPLTVHGEPLNNINLGWASWLTPVIPATQEAEIRRIAVQSQPG
jgi:hypothetical protein